MFAPEYGRLTATEKECYVQMLEKFGVDSVVFTKHGDLEYSVDFSEIGTYEEFYGTNEDE